MDQWQYRAVLWEEGLEDHFNFKESWKNKSITQFFNIRQFILSYVSLDKIILKVFNSNLVINSLKVFFRIVPKLYPLAYVIGLHCLLIFTFLLPFRFFWRKIWKKKKQTFSDLLSSNFWKELVTNLCCCNEGDD